ncbi:hypothetical protein L6452_08344 [Arctium lappa]|uniref:Uncharacterized protein n=1 Tax=Arctium lappa TaxID=4217 RepID=A0ACB9DI18_ARCLA|nr:hypothetical protein L6452_08344 [Arctium lappa]
MGTRSGIRGEIQFNIAGDSTHVFSSPKMEWVPLAVQLEHHDLPKTLAGAPHFGNHFWGIERRAIFRGIATPVVNLVDRYVLD